MPAGPDGPTQIGTRKCENVKCGRGTETGGKLMKQCAGCSSATYCSKECQKAAWPMHKPCCRLIKRNAEVLSSLDEDAQRFGYESSITFAQAMHEYTEAHQWAVYNMILAHILLKSGPSMAIAQREPIGAVMLRFLLVCQSTPATPRSQRNPATTFKVVEHGFMRMDYYATGPARNARLCADMIKECQTYHEKNLRSKTLGPFYVGVIPIVYTTSEVCVQHITLFPVFRPPNNINMDPLVKRVLHDLIRYCVYTMDNGFPLRAVDHSIQPYYAVPGRFTRSKDKQWIWEALFEEWAEYEDGRTHCGRLPGMEELGLAMSPGALMNLYTAFWVMKTATVVSLNLPTKYSV
ncbi:uncharacterized protein TRAVEDRAFT_46102 [Trametes versicolor FP-101664 SS1]|uniref:uncharacterized protein n=1 Tax=Trametes versicolor (strain FP-101664) TaxID=717944 RepID=UPI0004622B67|nr:uncharacterized protein TRAVEDRAFT_46102 [Trametes versicolor FP-101664 SS1]EIW60865.1 hypothetical protein TRAVEDRAFT_46102 [Trametes versicolor FP-101664 SS1]